MIIELPWDSSFFNLKIGKIEINSIDEVNFESINYFDLIYIYSNNLLLLNNDSTLKLVDEKITFIKKNLSNCEKLNSIKGYVVKEITKVTADLKKLCLQSGNYSRFKNDSNFSEIMFQKLYYEWLENSVQKILADVVFGVFHSNKIIGFITIKNFQFSSRIGLIAIDEKYRGLGLGKLLMSYSEHYCIKNNIHSLEVVTQNNNPACEFYRSCGYMETNKTFIYHLWNKNKI